MMSILYLIFIYPIEFIIRHILELSFLVTGSYGISIIIVSIVISLITLPLYHFANLMQLKEREIKKRMEPAVNDLKKVYRGYELHLYIKTLYRQNNYHPVYSLRSSMGLLLQVPFFIAAYHFLSIYEPLQGVSFLFFHDLGSPDGLVSLWELRINLLPFLMTGFSLLAGYVYTKNAGTGEKVQVYIISGLFFALLYNSPSGLLLYWTCNNIFNYLKHIGYSFFEKENMKNTVISGSICNV